MWFHPCSYICNCLKCQKSPKLTNIVMTTTWSNVVTYTIFKWVLNWVKGLGEKAYNNHFCCMICILQHSPISVWFYPCSYICNCLKMPKKFQIHKYSYSHKIHITHAAFCFHPIWFRSLEWEPSRCSIKKCGIVSYDAALCHIHFVWLNVGVTLTMEMKDEFIYVHGCSS